MLEPGDENGRRRQAHELAFIISLSMSARALPYVDPRAHRGLVYRAWARLVGTRAMGWLSRTIVWKADPYLMRLTGRRAGLGLMLPTALLETRGARSGRPRRSGVIYFHDGERVTIVASKLGLPEHPAWLHNLRANPDVKLGGHPFRAEVVEDEGTRARLWELADSVFPPYSAYRERAARTGRSIPIVQLIPL
jgi:deazaflavin-dependent oxidoreductase (nitroreductase family)